MSLKDFLNRKSDTVGFAIACVIFSAIVSACISCITVNRGTRNELKSALFKDDLPVLNRVSSIWEECSLYRVVVVASHTRIEEQPVVYVASDGREVRRDTLVKTSTVSDTSFVFVPKFAYEERSFDTVCANLDFIKENISILSPETYVSVNKMISYLETHPIQRPGERSEIVGSEWAKEEVYSAFYDIIGAIYASYVKRQQKYLSGHDY